MIKSTIQIRYSDIDTLMHVNNISLQYFFDIGKSYYIKEVVGIDCIFTDVGVVAANTNTNYYKTTLFEENIIVTSEIRKIGNKSITFFQEILNSDNGEKKADCLSVLVCFDAKSQSGVLIPDEWRERITIHENL